MRPSAVLLLAVACGGPSTSPTDGGVDAGPDASGEAGADGSAACPGLPPPPQQPGGTTYFVATTGSDASPGTEAQPFATIQHAAGLVAPGDTVVVADGTYSSGAASPVVTVSKGGQANDWVWFRAKNPHGAKIDGQGTATSGFAFESQAGFVRIEGFELFGMAANGSADAIECYGGGHDVEIVGNLIHDIGRNCTDTTNGEVGVFVEQPNVTIENNVFHDIGRLSPGENGCNPQTQYYMNHDHGIYADGNGDSTAPGTSKLLVRNNVFYDLKHGWGVQIYPGSPSGVHVIGNTFAYANPYKNGQIILYDVTLDDGVIENNVFYQPAGAAISVGGTLTLSNVSVRNNLTTAPAMTDSAPPSGMTVAGNLVSVADPGFVNAAANDFHLAAGSPAIDVGALETEDPFDLDGCARPRGAGFDMGAYER